LPGQIDLDAALDVAAAHVDLWAARTAGLALVEPSAASAATPVPPAQDRRPLRRVPRAETTWEGLRRLLNARCTAWERFTGEDAGDMRHAAARYASHGRTESSRQLRNEHEMGEAVSFVEHALHEAGYDLTAADA